VDLTSEHDNDIVYRYAHLSAREANGHYCPGDKIGETGVTGNASADRPHLHFQVINNGNAVDPIGFLTEPTMVVEQTGTATTLIDKTLPEPCNPC
jgi:murein DD-endopeptidase MepM/ murein hydrolase activator NlpD